MKKTLIALAALASTAAFAQSTVTIDGVVDLGIVKTTGSSAKLDATNGANQIRFRGTEDLGGGLSANFTLAQRFSPESGGNDGTNNLRPTFQGEATVGLAGAFGGIKIGRQLTAFQGPVNTTDPWGTLTQASTANLASGYVTDPAYNPDSAGAGRTDAITYSSPNFNGFSGAVSLGLKNSAPGGGVQAKNLTSLWLSYGAGPLYIGGGTEQNRQGDRVNAILGTYDFGVAKAGLGYSTVDTVATAGSDRKNWNAFVQVPMGAITFLAGYNNSSAEGTGVDTKKVGVGLRYAMSKRTYLYTNYGRSKPDGAAATAGYDVGIRHSF